MKKSGSIFPSVVTLVVVRTTKKIVGPPDPLSWSHKSLCQTLPPQCQNTTVVGLEGYTQVGINPVDCQS